MITVTYSGYCRVFTINNDKSIIKIYDNSLKEIFPNGIYCAEMNSSKQYLLLGSFASSNSNSVNYKKTSNGISIFRILNSEPWIKHVDIDKNEKSKQNESTKYNKGSSKMNYSKIVIFFFNSFMGIMIKFV